MTRHNISILWSSLRDDDHRQTYQEVKRYDSRHEPYYKKVLHADIGESMVKGIAVFQAGGFLNSTRRLTTDENGSTYGALMMGVPPIAARSLSMMTNSDRIRALGLNAFIEKHNLHNVQIVMEES